MMENDAALLRQYVQERSQAAFTALVRRHLPGVYSAALRQVGGDAHLAEDVAQSVFADLARKADRLVRHPVLIGWLHTSTHYAAAKTVRSEQRRRAREQKAFSMEDPTAENGGFEADWAVIRHGIDASIARLSEGDRHAILLRFFENRYAEVGSLLGLSENAARMRVERALERLRQHLARRGITSAAASLGAAMATHAIGAVPAGLSAAIASSALTGSAVGGALTLIQAFAMTKLQVSLAGALVIAGVSAVGYQLQSNAALEREISVLERALEESDGLQDENLLLRREADEIAWLRREAESLERVRHNLADLRATLSGAPLPSQTTSGEPQQAAREDVFEPSQLDVRPRPKRQLPPVYPESLRVFGVEGVVVVRFIVGESGSVQGVEVVDPTGSPFEQSALDSVSQWQFTPGIKDGVPVNAAMQVPIRFTLRDGGRDALRDQWF